RGPAVPDSSYDIVYTGIGALNWLPDIDRWAETAASLVAPGGFLYLAEFHPLTDCLDDETGSRIAHDYFSREAWEDETPGTYADFDAPPTVHNRSVEWQHPVGSVVSALAAAGLRIEFLHEHDVSLFARFPVLKRGSDDFFRFPSDRPRIPLDVLAQATRPAA
nr:SAM-dependent methyltransferase [Streptomyces sp. SID7803]